MAAWRSGRGDGRTHIIVPELPGDVALVRTASGHTVLLDGGGDGIATIHWLGRELPFWRRRLDLVLLTRADEQTLPGQTAVLRRYTAGAIGYVRPSKSSASFAAWQDAVARHGGALRVLEAGLRLRVDDVDIEVLTLQGERATVLLKVGCAHVYALQSTLEGDAELLTARVQEHADLLLFPWLVRPDNQLAEHLQPRLLIYTSGGNTSLQQTFAERWNGTVPLLHPALHGRIDWSIAGEQGEVNVERRPTFAGDAGQKFSLGSLC